METTTLPNKLQALVDPQEVRQFANLHMRNGQVIEIRVLDGMLLEDRLPYNKPRILNGWFNDVEALVESLQGIASATGVYATINPCVPDLLAKVNNRIIGKATTATSGEQIIARRNLLLDLDPARVANIAGIPTNNTEHQTALDLGKVIRDTLSAEGWPLPVEIDSGNGAYLLYAVDLPADDGGLVERVLKGVAERFDTKQVHVDQTTFDLPRIMRVPGTGNCKGDGTKDRPHRDAKLLSIPDEIHPVPTELLEAIAIPVEQAQPKQEQKSTSKSTSPKKDKQPPDYLDEWNVAYGSQQPYNNGSKWQLTNGCPFCSNNDHNAFVYIRPNGELGFKCSHNSCTGLHWQDFRLRFEPTAYDKRDDRSNTTTYSPGQAPSSNANGHKEAESGLPRVILGGQLRDSRDESLQHLGKSEEQDPTIFVQSGRLVQTGRDKDHKTIIMAMGVPEIKNALTKAADFFTLRKKGDDYSPAPASPPKEIAEAILALSPSKWPFKQLEAIVETPVIRPDGTILQKPGYDELTKLYYAPHKDMHACTVPERPSEEEVQNARAVLEDIIIEFPFVDQSDMANMLALMITPIIRPAIKRHVPLALLDAPKQASGKGLLADVVSIVATGEPASILTAPGNDEEWRKEITSILMKGSTIIAIDNLPGRLQSSKLDAVLTADWWTDRLLGGNTMVRVRQRAVWLATGNNIKVGGDLARRCYRIRIDPKMSKPWTRAGFKYEDLATHCSEHRSQIIAAILTLVRAWFVAGCPQDKSILSMATFTGWARMAGSILSFAGIEGFLGNLNKLYDEMDVENAQWALFLQAWQDMFGEKAIPVKMLIAALAEEKENDTPNQKPFEDLNEGSTGGAEKSTGGALAEYLPDNLQTALKEKPKSFNIILGKALESKREACFGERDLRLEKVKDTDAKQWTWKVVTGGTGGANNPSVRKNYSSASDTENEKTEENNKYNVGIDDYPYHPYEESTQNGKYATNQGEKTTEPLSDIRQDDLFTGTPPVNSNTPPVTDSRLPNRACMKCDTLDWAWDETLEIAVCRGCA
ncbi:MAG TPA: hypothetical protein VHV10_20685 [Ktedonobacteraceae bacterium]|jgi:hypothetical protein|nr:hypothetical protein [Ktedonobacteraceae bacterium]